MIGFYKDAGLTLLITETSPKKFLFPLAGLSKTTSVWLGDPNAVTYTSTDNVIISIAGADTLPPNPNVRVSLGLTPSVGLQGVPVILSTNTITGGVLNAIQIYLQVTVSPGSEAEFINIQLEVTPLSTGGNQVSYISAPFDVARWDSGMPIRTNVLPTNRQLSANLPGFIFGQYRWRDVGEINAQSLVPTIWNPDVNAIGPEKFIYGIGVNDDLKLIDIEEPPYSDSINPRVNHGTFWTGYRRYFYPADGSVLEFLPCGPNQSLEFVLQQTPRNLSPIFVGTWNLDEEGFYEYKDNYRYMGNVFPPGITTQQQYTLVRRTKLLTLNNSLASGTVLLGTTSGQTVDYFQLPIHPVARITNLIGTSIVPQNLNLDLEQGKVTITWPAASIPNTGTVLSITYDPAVAVYYETGVDDGTVDTTSILDPVELNPAFSGVAAGYLYLQNRRQLAARIELVADKPPILLDNGLIANGPIYYINDFALLTATVFGEVPDETIPGITMKVVVDETFQGLLNYKNPLYEDVLVVSGGDGKANLVYTPDQYAQETDGEWIDPVTSIAGSIMNVYTDIPLDTLGHWDNTKGVWVWDLYTYQVLDNNPLFGMVGGDPALGQIVWNTNLGSSVGTSGYRTNGQLKLYVDSGAPVYPVTAWSGGDGTGVALNVDPSTLDPLQARTVNSLTYGSPITTGEPIGAYYLSYIKRVSLYLQDINSNVRSNTVILQLQNPTIINDDLFLIVAGMTSDGVAYATSNSVLNLNRLAISTPNSTQVALTSRV